MLLEAFVFLIAARAAVLFVPFTRIGRHLGAMQPAARLPASAEVSDVGIAKDVRWAVNAVANRSPLEMVCLPRALAAWRMLQRRKVPSRLHFGVPLQPDPSRRGVQTHAWLSSCGVEVTGYPVAHGCVELGFFSRVDPVAADRGGVPVESR